MTAWTHKGRPVERQYPPAQVLLANGKPAYTAKEEPEPEPPPANIVRLRRAV